MNSLHQFLNPVDIPLSEIFLDPNNPRFTEASWDYIKEEDWHKPDVQEAAQRRLVTDFGVEKLRMNMEVNGFLAIDRVIVKRFSENQYVVLEGNRRICAAKMVGPIAIDGSAVSENVLESLQIISCLLYTGTDTDAAWVFQGLRHISGIVEWSAFNKAKLLVEQMEKEHLGLTEVGRRFGLSAHGAGQWVRGYNAFHQGRESSDHINEIDERSYPYFQELFGRSSAPLREWLSWDDDDYEFKNKLNLDEFISWLYPRQEMDSDTAGVKKGDFDRRRIARRDDLRQLSELFVKDREIFDQFRNGIPLEACYAIFLSKQHDQAAKLASDPLADVFESVNLCIKSINNVPFKAMKNPETVEKIHGELNRLKETITDFIGEA